MKGRSERMPRGGRDAPEPAGLVFDAQLHLFDRQILDRDGVPISAVDDVELTGVEAGHPIAPDAPAPVIDALLVGTELATRIFGGSPPPSRRDRIPWKLVEHIGIVVRVGVRGHSLDVTWPERWIADRVIGRIPGGRHDPE